MASSFAALQQHNQTKKGGGGLRAYNCAYYQQARVRQHDWRKQTRCPNVVRCCKLSANIYNCCTVLLYESHTYIHTYIHRRFQWSMMQSSRHIDWLTIFAKITR
ncbi:unnamed protein product [Ceratitis capitata]|uniref:(Mediterranean fruit fly) hypothetical protein n=1 Tax=Ceratitis capitata TaxID=7213 RepID=A0A811UL53_CERCA|nr:unnamed protein product [Ceratitis capitata]